MSGRRRRSRRRKPELSQHFLVDRVATRLAEKMSADDVPTAIEIGGGRGALTDKLVAKFARLQTIEVDPYLADQLRRKQLPGVEVVLQDFLKMDLPASGRYVVLGNIPFAISTQIVSKIAQTQHQPVAVHLIVQKEFAYRCCGHPYCEETAWSLALRAQWHISITEILEPQSFSPPPSVDSAVMRMVPLRDAAVITSAEREQFSDYVHRAFGYSTIKRFLKSRMSYNSIKRLTRDHRIVLSARPSELYLEQWIAMYKQNLS